MFLNIKFVVHIFLDSVILVNESELYSKIKHSHCLLLHPINIGGIVHAFTEFIVFL